MYDHVAARVLMAGALTAFLIYRCYFACNKRRQPPRLYRVLRNGDGRIVEHIVLQEPASRPQRPETPSSTCARRGAPRSRAPRCMARLGPRWFIRLTTPRHLLPHTVSLQLLRLSWISHQAPVMGTTVYGARPPSHTAYYVALGGIVLLLFLLCGYFFYFCVKRVKELTKEPDSIRQPVSATPVPPTYPVQSAVRDSATAIAKLCNQLPQPSGKGSTVFPTSTSPAAQQTDTGRVDGPVNTCNEVTDKIPTPAVGRTEQDTVAAR